MSPLHAFFLGCLGALAPEIVRLYSIRTQPSRFKWSSFYVMISIVFSCLGGALAVVLPAVTPWGALYAGISAPVLVSTAAKKAINGSALLTRSPRATVPINGAFRTFLEGL